MIRSSVQPIGWGWFGRSAAALDWCCVAFYVLPQNPALAREKRNDSAFAQNLREFWMEAHTMNKFAGFLEEAQLESLQSVCK